MSDLIFPESRVTCDNWTVGDGFQIGRHVIIECRKACIGRNVKIGLETDDNFRQLAGVRIKVDELILGDGVIIDRAVLVKGGKIQLEKEVQVRANTTFNVTQSLKIDSYGVINEGGEISGVEVEIGRHLWMLPRVKIGGGSAFEVHSRLRVGHFCHLGLEAFLNTARAIDLGNEVGLGTRTALYTHGAYPSVLRGAPVAFAPIHIGDRSWLPGATVNPGVTIGNDCVIGVGAVVTRDVPDGALAAGIPAKVIKNNAFPLKLSLAQKRAIMTDLLRVYAEICTDRHQVELSETDDTLVIQLDKHDIKIAYTPFAPDNWIRKMSEKTRRVICLAHSYAVWPEADLPAETTVIDLDVHKVLGQADAESERLINQLRRYGIRFRFSPEHGVYMEW